MRAGRPRSWGIPGSSGMVCSGTAGGSPALSAARRRRGNAGGPPAVLREGPGFGGGGVRRQRGRLARN